MALNSLFCADVPLSNYSLTPVLAARFIFTSRPVSLYTVSERVKSRFHKDHIKREEKSL